MNYPALARLPCKTCCLFHIEYDWSRHEGTAEIELDREGNHSRREEGDTPPCMEADGSRRMDKQVCPKGHPSEERHSVLSDRNRQAWELYKAVQATSGACLTDAMRRDALLMRNLGIIHRIVTQSQQYQQAKDTGSRVALEFLRLQAEVQ